MSPVHWWMMVPHDSFSLITLSILNRFSLKFLRRHNECVDTLWLYSSLIFSKPPNWQVFMSLIVESIWIHWSCLQSHDLMIALNFQSNDTVVITMVVAQSQARKCDIWSATVFKKLKNQAGQSSTIPTSISSCRSPADVLWVLDANWWKVQVLMDLWATVYTNNSLPKMMESTIYTKILRACLLTDAALHISLLQAAKCPISSDLPSHSPSAPPETARMATMFHPHVLCCRSL